MKKINRSSTSSFIRNNSERIRSKVIMTLAEANAGVHPLRQVSLKSAVTVVNRDLARTLQFPDESRVMSALKAVHAHIALVQRNRQTTASLRNTDLLPIGHPASTRGHAMTASALLRARGAWIASDSLIDESVRPLVAAAHSALPGSVAREHAFIRLSLIDTVKLPLTASVDPLSKNTVDLQPVVAAGGFGLGGNSRAARSARAKLQRRDRYGRFAFMGGGFMFNLRLPDGMFKAVSGRVVGASGDDGIEIEVAGSPDLKDGIYTFPASKGRSFKATLPKSYLKSKNIAEPEASSVSDGVSVDMDGLKRMDAPSGWKLLSTDSNGMQTFESEDGYFAQVKPDADSYSLHRADLSDNSVGEKVADGDSWADVQQAARIDSPDYEKVLEAAGREDAAAAPKKPVAPDYSDDYDTVRDRLREEGWSSNQPGYKQAFDRYLDEVARINAERKKRPAPSGPLVRPETYGGEPGYSPAFSGGTDDRKQRLADWAATQTGNDFLKSVSDQFKKKGSLSKKQWDALDKAAKKDRRFDSFDPSGMSPEKRGELTDWARSFEPAMDIPSGIDVSTGEEARGFSPDRVYAYKTVEDFLRKDANGSYVSAADWRGLDRLRADIDSGKVPVGKNNPTYLSGEVTDQTESGMMPYADRGDTLLDEADNAPIGSAYRGYRLAQAKAMSDTLGRTIAMSDAGRMPQLEERKRLLDEDIAEVESAKFPDVIPSEALKPTKRIGMDPSMTRPSRPQFDEKEPRLYDGSGVIFQTPEQRLQELISTRGFSQMLYDANPTPEGKARLEKMDAEIADLRRKGATLPGEKAAPGGKNIRAIGANDAINIIDDLAAGSDDPAEAGKYADFIDEDGNVDPSTVISLFDGRTVSIGEEDGSWYWQLKDANGNLVSKVDMAENNAGAYLFRDVPAGKRINANSQSDAVSIIDELDAAVSGEGDSKYADFIDGDGNVDPSTVISLPDGSTVSIREADDGSYWQLTDANGNLVSEVDVAENNAGAYLFRDVPEGPGGPTPPAGPGGPGGPGFPDGVYEIADELDASVDAIGKLIDENPDLSSQISKSDVDPLRDARTRLNAAIEAGDRDAAIAALEDYSKAVENLIPFVDDWSNDWWAFEGAANFANRLLEDLRGLPSGPEGPGGGKLDFDLDVAFDVDTETIEDVLDRIRRETGAEGRVIDPAGPAGGWPVVRFTVDEDKFENMLRSIGYDDQRDIDEFRERARPSVTDVGGPNFPDNFYEVVDELDALVNAISDLIDEDPDLRTQIMTREFGALVDARKKLMDAVDAEDRNGVMAALEEYSKAVDGLIPFVDDSSSNWWAFEDAANFADGLLEDLRKPPTPGAPEVTEEDFPDEDLTPRPTVDVSGANVDEMRASIQQAIDSRSKIRFKYGEVDRTFTPEKIVVNSNNGNVNVVGYDDGGNPKTFTIQKMSNPTPPRTAARSVPVKALRGTTLDERRAEFEDAIASGEALSFEYNGKPRSFIPERIYTSSTGNTNVSGVLTEDGSDRTFSIDKIENTAPAPSDEMVDDEMSGEFDAMFDSIFTAPESAYRIDVFNQYMPVGRTNESSTDYTDDPEVLASMFENGKLVTALVEAVLPLDGRPGTGYAMLPFEGGDEAVKAEAIYEALMNKGIDANAFLAAIYDTGLLREGKEAPNFSNVIGERDGFVADPAASPFQNAIALTRFDQQRIDAQRVKDETRRIAEQTRREISTERLINTGRVVTALQEYDEQSASLKKVAEFLRQNQERSVLDLFDPSAEPPADATQEEEDAFLQEVFTAESAIAREMMMEAYSALFDNDGDDIDGFLGAWGILMSLDGGVSDLQFRDDPTRELTDRRLRDIANGTRTASEDTLTRVIFQPLLEKANGNFDVARATFYELINTYGTYPDFVESREALLAGEYDLSEEGLGSAFMRLIKDLASPSSTPMTRVIGVPKNDQVTIDAYTTPGSQFSLDPRPWSMAERGYELAADPSRLTSIRFTADPGQVDAFPVSQISWFIEENEGLGFGTFEVVSVEQTQSMFGSPETLVRIRRVTPPAEPADIVRDLGVEEAVATPAPAPSAPARQSWARRSFSGIADWTQTARGTGSNPGGFFTDPDGNEYYVKVPHSRSHAEMETLASMLYRAMDIPVAEVGLGEDDGDLRIVSPLIPDADPYGFIDAMDGDDRAIIDRVREDFVADAWLGNYDVIGYVLDGSTNIVLDGDRNPVRVDQGGSLIWRARGLPKGDRFGDAVTDIDTMRDPDLAPQATRVFGDMTDDELRSSAQKVANVSPEMIDEIVESAISDPDEAQMISNRLKARRLDIINRFNIPQGNENPDFDPVERFYETPTRKAQDLVPGDAVFDEDRIPFVVERVFRDDSTPEGRVSIQGFYPGHTSQRREFVQDQMLVTSFGDDLPPKGDRPGIYRPDEPRPPRVSTSPASAGPTPASDPAFQEQVLFRMRDTQEYAEFMAAIAAIENEIKLGQPRVSGSIIDLREKEAKKAFDEKRKSVVSEMLDSGWTKPDPDEMERLEYEAEMAQYSDDLADFTALKAVAALWNCGGGRGGVTAAIGDGGDGGDSCGPVNPDDLVRMSTPGSAPEGVPGDRPDRDGVDVRDPYADEAYPPTPQQREIIDAVMTGEDTVVRALAGTGKTSTLRMIARQIAKRFPGKRIIYVAFNKSIQEEAAQPGVFPGNVEARTADSIAYRAMKAMRPKIVEKWAKNKFNTKPNDVAAKFGITEIEIPDPADPSGSRRLTRREVVALVRKTVTNFTISADDELGMQHVAMDDPDPQVLSWAQSMWGDLTDPNGWLPVNNSHLTKMWAMTRPDLSKQASGLTHGADVVFFDEAQDINPVLGRVIADQKIQKVYVGDGNQAIYAFRGAEDELQKVTAPHDLPLTKSWRFGPQVAGIGNRFLALLGSPHRIEGAGPAGEIVPRGAMQDAEAVLVRSNMGAIKEIFTELQRGRKVGVSSNFKASLTSFADTAKWLINGANFSDRPSNIHEELSQYSSWDDVIKDAEGGDIKGPLKTFVDFVSKNGLDGLYDMLDRVEVYTGSEDGKGAGSGGLPPIADADVVSGGRGTVANVDGRPLTYEVRGSTIVLAGNTFGANKKVSLKTLGFRYDGDSKTWIKNTPSDAERARALNDVRSRVDDGGSSGPKIDVVVTTAHRAKGLEWDNVRIGNDFRGPRPPKDDPEGEPIMPSPEEMRLAYVAVTRAKKRLDPGALDWVYDYTTDEDESPFVAMQVPETPEAPEAPAASEEPETSLTETDLTPLTDADVPPPPDDAIDSNLSLMPDDTPTVEPGAPDEQSFVDAIKTQIDDFADTRRYLRDAPSDVRKKANELLDRAVEAANRYINGDADLDETRAELQAVLNEIREMPGKNNVDLAQIDVKNLYEMFSDRPVTVSKDLPPPGSGRGFDKNGVFIMPGMRVRDKWGYAGTVVQYDKNGHVNVWILQDVDQRDPSKLKEAARAKWGALKNTVSKNTGTLTVIEEGDDDSPWIDVGKPDKGPKDLDAQLEEVKKIREKEAETGEIQTRKLPTYKKRDLPKAPQRITKKQKDEGPKPEVVEEKPSAPEVDKEALASTDTPKDRVGKALKKKVGEPNGEWVGDKYLLEGNGATYTIGKSTLEGMSPEEALDWLSDDREIQYSQAREIVSRLMGYDVTYDADANGGEGGYIVKPAAGTTEAMRQNIEARKSEEAWSGEESERREASSESSEKKSLKIR